MSFTHRNNNLRLLARNEGKIKSYDSCCDVRAWSHDLSTQDRYLREWIKTDMPISVIPASTLSNFLRTMTCKSRRRATPRCHPDCKSKVLLESICTSCLAVKECLQQNEELEKYFIEEELESSNWPCDRCLEALKSIKMFWKIIMDKLFSINFSKSDFESDCGPVNSVRSVAKVWQNEMLQQVCFVKNIRPTCAGASNIFRCRSPKREFPETPFKSRSCRIQDCGDRHKVCDSRSCNIRPRDRQCTTISKGTSFKIRTMETGCDTCFIGCKDDEIQAYRQNLKVLQDKCYTQNKELEKLRRENNSLRIELENVYTRCPWKPSLCSSNDTDNSRKTVTIIPKPFEANAAGTCPCPKNIDSEMIITMKNCKNESFRHVSLLQVLHKTNGPITEDLNIKTSGCKRKDPIAILNKVKTTFGAIVKREMTIVNERRQCPKKTDVNATFHRINVSKSAPSCTTLPSVRSSDDYVSTIECCDRNSNIKIIHI